MENIVLTQQKLQLGLQMANSLSHKRDQLVRLLFNNILSTDLHAYISIIATGGYGQKTLAPHSDLDLCFLITTNKQHLIMPLIEKMLYALWDHQLSLGYVVGTQKEILNLCTHDHSWCTALIDRRLICGSHILFQEFSQQYDFFQAHNSRKFIIEKFTEREQRIQKTQHKPYNNIKNDCGGVRDIQFIFWLLPYLNKRLSASELKEINKTSHFLWEIRFLLHQKYKCLYDNIHLKNVQWLTPYFHKKSANSFFALYQEMTGNIQNIINNKCIPPAKLLLI